MTETKFHIKMSQFRVKSPFKEWNGADGGYSLNWDFTVVNHRIEHALSWLDAWGALFWKFYNGRDKKIMICTILGPFLEMFLFFILFSIFGKFLWRGSVQSSRCVSAIQGISSKVLNSYFMSLTQSNTNQKDKSATIFCSCFKISPDDHLFNYRENGQFHVVKREKSGTEKCLFFH